MKQPKWLTLEMIVAIHDEALHYFGGLEGIRDRTLLESAIDKPRNKIAYEPQSSLYDLAATLGVGLARNHAFVDGNKRTALLATRAFLYLNDCVLEPTEEDEVIMMVGVATGAVVETDFAVWLQKNSKIRKTRVVPKKSRPRSKL